jgi:hypothetical protein
VFKYIFEEWNGIKLDQNNVSVRISNKVLCYIALELALFPHNKIDICEFLELLAHNESAMCIPCSSVRTTTMNLNC